ncbi:hypothetical protein DXT74_08050 [Chromobacterium sp. Rain0013]|nr:hypothetical protein DXT74_08050 [Chromobacterium sp. Rain0013]
MHNTYSSGSGAAPVSLTNQETTEVQKLLTILQRGQKPSLDWLLAEGFSIQVIQRVLRLPQVFTISSVRIADGAAIQRLYWQGEGGRDAEQF